MNRRRSINLWDGLGGLLLLTLLSLFAVGAFGFGAKLVWLAFKIGWDLLPW